MTSYIVSYDLKNTEGSQDYQPLWDYFEAHEAQRVQESLWFLSSSLSARKLTELLMTFVDPSTNFFISELVDESWWENEKEGTNEWFKANPPLR
ncbi:MAG: hypothetical protein ABF979_11975 [Gluconobacter sp.]|uniref:hypothetical protein n=1 Tax=Gluconobacter sp. TaxID=1876758 RepID=UPI0039ECD04C